jgi:hypothetical protein
MFLLSKLAIQWELDVMELVKYVPSTFLLLFHVIYYTMKS